MNDLPLLEPASVAEWAGWLEANHATSDGVWLAVGKKGGTRTSLTYEQAVEEAVAWGWIDSTVHAMDEHRFRQLFTPRKRGSIWAASNKARVERLSEQGRMRPSGLAVVAAAKADGAWQLLDDVEALVVPADLADALALDEEAAEGYDALPDSAKKQLLYWISSARRPETRARRIAAAVEAAAERRLPSGRMTDGARPQASS